MIRVLLAAMLLRSKGITVQYVVRRKYNGIGKQGTTILKADRFKDARNKYQSMRIADTDTITITIESAIAQRHGTVSAAGSLAEAKENNNA